MAWSTPSTRATDDVVTAAIWNQDAVSNPIFLHDPPSCRVYNSANISISNATNTALTFNSERWDTDTMHSTSTNTGRLTFTTAGKYLITAHVRFAANATGMRNVTVRANGSTILASNQRDASAGSWETDFSFSTLYAFNAADYVELLVYQDSTAALDVTVTANYSPEFAAVWVSG